MPRRKSEKTHGGNLELEPQKSGAAQFITYIASTGQGSEKYELRYEDENIWVSLTMPSSVERIGDLSFSGCIHLTAVYNPCSLQRVGEHAFGLCPISCVHVAVGDADRVKKILGKFFFSNDSRLENVKFIEDYTPTNSVSIAESKKSNDAGKGKENAR